MWTHTDPAQSAAIVIFKPGSLDPRRLSAALTEKDEIVVTARAGEDRPGLRLSPHFYQHDGRDGSRRRGDSSLHGDGGLK